MLLVLQRKNLADSLVKNIAEEFRKGSVHACRVLDFNYVDNVAGVTLKQ